MQPNTFYKSLVDPMLGVMADYPLIKVPRSKEADVLVMAIAGQESEWKARRQVGIGQYHPQTVGARSYWQFESTWAGPVAINDILQSTPRQITAFCEMMEIPCDELTLYEACAWNDGLACVMARLLLWIHPKPLPAIGDREAAWQYYLSQWRPGKPHRQTWDARYDASLAAING